MVVRMGEGVCVCEGGGEFVGQMREIEGQKIKVFKVVQRTLERSQS